jgi:intracellular septation protein A
MTKKNPNGNPWLNIGVNVILPSIILIRLSDEKYLGPVWGILLALAFPISYGLFEYVRARKTNFFSVIGLIGVLLTGGISLFELSRGWMVFKETAVPTVMGVAVFASGVLKKPFIRLLFRQFLDLEKIDHAFTQNQHTGIFEKQLSRSNFFLSGTFFISAVLNYVLAQMILVGEPGTTEFNESLGQMTFLSFPVIALPMMLMFMGIFLFLSKSIKSHTDLNLEDFVKNDLK